ncbi:MAG: hypothetical protein J1F16_10525 [Muribaculaceae bacterium]|nr:hypothetical protein [Muribaculaceae bacterium]
MKEIKEKEKVAKDIITPKKEFKGYTIEELRFQRALIAMEADFCKTKMCKSVTNLQEANPFMSGGKTSIPGKAGAIALKMLTGLNYLDYALLGMSAFKGARKIYSFFKGKRK